jgi:alkanesulfonate monooxygenase SsuD/methylene tetrahydromethanopterin reductase-like flavin-dependent oxidoreductase (luciferase family)
MKQVDFGLFDWIDRGTAPIHQLYEDRLQLLEAAEAAGFFGYHLAEHHATPLGMAPSPALFLTAAAQRTRRIRLGPLVYLLPLYNPLRLIEEICMLDQLSGGRLELGVGRGVTPYELRYFGVDPDGTRAIFDETLAVLVAGLTNSRLNFAGAHYQYRDVPMELHPLQRPYPPLWYPTHNPESVQYAARHGYNFVGLGPAAAVRHHVDAYWQTWEAHRHDPNRLNGHVAAPKVGVLRQVVVAETDDKALAVTRPAYADWYRSITKLLARSRRPQYRWPLHVGGCYAAGDTPRWLTGARARAGGPAGGGKWLQLCDLFVRLGHLAPPAGTALTAAVCAGGDARIFRQRCVDNINRRPQGRPHGRPVPAAQAARTG